MYMYSYYIFYSLNAGQPVAPVIIPIITIIQYVVIVVTVIHLQPEIKNETTDYEKAMFWCNYKTTLRDVSKKN